MALVLSVALGVFVLDQLTKALARATLAGQPPLGRGAVRLALVENPSGPAGLFRGKLRAQIVGDALTLLLVLSLSLVGRFGHPWAVGLFVGGVAGNLWDRVTRKAVTDFLVLGPLVVNAADLCINLGLILALLSLI